jgi:hypothetical protein
VTWGEGGRSKVSKVTREERERTQERKAMSAASREIRMKQLRTGESGKRTSVHKQQCNNIVTTLQQQCNNSGTIV